jgi:hypothetical protein
VSWASRSASSGSRTTSVPTNGRRDAKRVYRTKCPA